MPNRINSELIGVRIKHLRNLHGYTLENMAEVLNITWQHLANIESGRRRVTVEFLVKLKENFDVSADYILFGISNKPSYQQELIGLISSIDESIYPYVIQSISALLCACDVTYEASKSSEQRNEH